MAQPSPLHLPVNGRKRTKLAKQAFQKAQFLHKVRTDPKFKAIDMEILKPPSVQPPVKKYTEVYLKYDHILLKQYAPFREPKIWTESYPEDDVPLVIVHA